MSKSEDSVRVAVDGLSEPIRARVSSAYRVLGGQWSRPEIANLRHALRSVRRQVEVAGQTRIADDLTRREDALEMLAGRTRQRTA